MHDNRPVRPTRADFAPVLDEGEALLWIGAPARTPYLATTIPLLTIGLIWGAVDYFAFIRHIRPADAPASAFFFLLHLFPLWLGLGNLVITLLAHKHTRYAITDRRILVRDGIFSPGYRSHELRDLRDLDVSTGLFEKKDGLGTLMARVGEATENRNNNRVKFIGIARPHEVMRELRAAIEHRRAPEAAACAR